MKYICQICGYVYDEAKEGVPFADLPDTWTCPLCGAPKSVFAAEAIQIPSDPTPAAPTAATSTPAAAPAAPAAQVASAPASAEASVSEDQLEELSAGQLAALCSNLARGCEKQYRTEESKLFAQLANYFTAQVASVEDATVERMSELLKAELAAYPNVRATVDAEGDRGAARICVWGEKVTRMLSSLVDRYLKNGDSFLEGTNVWVCTTCGFVYVGDNPPATCPVCKVPAWKFEKIARRA